MARASGEALKRRIVGFSALGVLVFLVGYGLWSRETDGTAPVEPARRIEVPSAGLTESLPPVPPRGTEIVARLDQPVLSPQARLLAERFQCVCGCNDILATCTCSETPGSRDMKQYVQELVNEGKTPAEVEAAMVERYGEKVLPR